MNDYKFPENEQELLERFIEARRSVINEFSGNITEDCLRLRAWAARFAERRGLKAPEGFEFYGVYQTLFDIDQLSEWIGQGLLIEQEIEKYFDVIS